MEETRILQIQEIADRMEVKGKSPSISPFKGATLTVLRFLFINGEGYSSQIAKLSKLTPARVCQVLKELEGKGIVGSSSKISDCGYCAGTGRKNYGTKAAECIYCVGSGKLKEKSYPVIYRIEERSKNAIYNIFNAIYDINSAAIEKAEKQNGF